MILSVRSRRERRAAPVDRPAQVARRLRPLAVGGDPEAQFHLAGLYETGHGLVQSFTDAAHWFRAAAEQGHVLAQARLGEIYLTGRSAPASVGGAARPELGRDSGGDGVLTRLFPDGHTIDQDFVEAARWNRLAAAAGDAGAQARLGYLCASGLGIERNYTAARAWFTAAAEQDNPAGQLGLGMLLAGGHCGPPDFAAAISWIEKAVAHGNPTAKLCLAVLCLRGDAWPRDDRRAAQLLAEAADQDQPEAMYYLGELYRTGRGTALDPSAAETWLLRAAIRG